MAVSISSGVENLGSAIPFVIEHKTFCAIGAIVLLTLMNLRGVKESGKLFAIPTYLFVAGVFLMILWGAFRGLILGDTMHAPTSDFEIKPEHEGLAGFALVFLLLRAFSRAVPPSPVSKRSATGCPRSGSRRAGTPRPPSP